MIYLDYFICFFMLDQDNHNPPKLSLYCYVVNCNHLNFPMVQYNFYLFMSNSLVIYPIRRKSFFLLLFNKSNKNDQLIIF